MHVCVIVRRGRESPLRSAVDLRFRRGSKIMKNYTQGRVENQRKSEAGRVLGALGAVLGIFGALWWELLAKLGQIGRKMIEVGARMASSRVLDGP